MKNKIKNNLERKKGFTLIEIIISIVLIVLIGGTITFLLVNNKDDNEKEVNKITNQILEAANVYVNSMKDKNGNSFLTEISKGAKGVKIPISLLVEKGLIDEKVSKDLEKSLNNVKDNSGNKKTAEESYYILYLQGGTVENENYCEQGPITIASWTMKENEPIYLCNDYDKDDGKDSGAGPNQEPSAKDYIIGLNDLQIRTVDLTKYAVSVDYKKNHSSATNLVDNENGLFVTMDSEGTYYFFRGAVDNNYFKFAGETWRILRINPDGSIRLILNDVVEPKIYYLVSNYTNKNDTLKGKETLTRHTCGYSCWIGNKCKDKVIINCDAKNYTYVNFKTTNVTGNNESNLKYLASWNMKFDKIDIKEIYESLSSGKFYAVGENNIFLKILNAWYNEIISNNYRKYINETNNFCDYSAYYYYSPSNSKPIVPDSLRCSVAEERAIIEENYNEYSGNYGASGESQKISLSVGTISRNEMAYAGYGIKKLLTYDGYPNNVVVSGDVGSNGSAPNNDNFLNINKDFILGDPFYNNNNKNYGINYVNGTNSSIIYSDPINYKVTKLSTDGNIRNRTIEYYANTVADGNEILSLGYTNVSDTSSLTTYTIDLGWINNIRPVINIKADVKLSGDGTSDNPFMIVE